MVKFTILLRRRPDLSHEQFVDYHRHSHAPLFTSLAVVATHVRRYVQQHTVPVTLPGLPTAPYDGATELWFDDVGGIAAVFTAPDYLSTVRPDEERFLDMERCDFMITHETSIIHHAKSAG